MLAEVNGNHVVANFRRARLITYAKGQDYFVCGNIVIANDWVFMSGHANASTNFEPVVGIAMPRQDVQVIIDHSVEACETHDKMDAEARAQMESLKNAEESKED